MFTRMDQSTEEEWQHISEEHMPHIFDMPKRIISMLKQAKRFNTWLWNRSITSCIANSHNGKKGWC